jgi:hypothetical protein
MSSQNDETEDAKKGHDVCYDCQALWEVGWRFNCALPQLTTIHKTSSISGLGEEAGAWIVWTL